MSSLLTHCRDEDTQALQHFGPGFRGCFLDLGAHNPAAGGSITLLLAEQGWHGVWVEGSWRTTGKLIEQARRFEGRVEVVHGAVGARHGLALWWDSDGYSTCCPEVQAVGAERVGAFRMHVPLLTPDDLLVAFPGPFHVVSIDVEGWSLEVMRAFPWEASGCRFAVIEAFRPHNLGVDEVPIVRSFMESKGFRHLTTNVDNVVMVR